MKITRTRIGYSIDLTTEEYLAIAEDNDEGLQLFYEQLPVHSLGIGESIISDFLPETEEFEDEDDFDDDEDDEVEPE